MKNAAVWKFTFTTRSKCWDRQRSSGDQY